MPTIFVDGQEGTTGLTLLDQLNRRPDIKLLTIAPERRKDRTERRQLLNQAEIVFLCLPEEAAREAVSLVSNPGTCIIDASPAFRLDPTWVYGLPELEPTQRDHIRTSKRIAVPGCHATAFLLLVRPLIAKRMMPPDYPLSCTSITGYSGGGKRLIQRYEQQPTSQLQSPRPCALHLNHRHLPEMMTHSGLAFAPIFVPVVGNYYKGLAVTIFLHSRLLTQAATPEALHELLTNYYAGEPFVRVMPMGDDGSLDGRCLDVQGCKDTNRVDLFIFGNAERIALMARLDNLGKGASGAAIQCMNIYCQLTETTGLRVEQTEVSEASHQ